MPGKQKGEKSGVEIGTWKARLKASGLMFDRLRREREEFERALALQDGVRDWSAFRNISEALEQSAYAEQTVPLSYRYAIWLQAQTAGEPPVIRYPRTAGGDEVFATTIEDLLLRVWIESGAQREWQQAIFDLCGFGSTCVWHGFHSDIVSMDEVEGAKEGVEETVARALHGDPTALPGQDRGMAQHALTTALEDEVNRIALPLEAQQGLAQAAMAQIDAGVAEARKPKSPTVEHRELWTRRLRIGSQVRWDHTVSDLRDCRWMARRIVMRPDEAKKWPGFTASARKNIKLSRLGKEDGVELVLDVEGKPADGPENGRFVCWQILDKEFGTQHYVSEEMDEFLEADETYPFNDPKTGRPAIPGFFPCVVSAPVLHSRDVPERTAGTPLIAPGYPIQREIVKLHNFALASVKRHSIRMYEVPDDLDKDTEAQLASGEDGALIRRKAGIEPGKMVMPVQFTGEAYKIIDLIGRLTGEWSMIQGIPMADLTSQPQADTATQEELGVSAGRNQADYVIRQVELAMARSVEIQRAMLAIGLYPPEKIAALIGPGREDVVAAWQASSLDGDAITLKSASRAKADQAVRIKQLGDALSLTVGYMDPKTGLQVYDASQIMEELLLSLDVGRPKRIEWTPEDLMMRAMLGGGGAGQGPGGPPGKGPGEKKRAEGPTDAAHEGAAARRTGT